MRALVLDEGRDRAALTAVRSLAADGWTVGTASSGARSLSSRSRGSSRWHDVPDVGADPERFADGVIQVVKDGGYELIFLAWEQAVLALSRRRERLGCVFPYPQHDVLERCYDKLAVAEAAREVGIATPRTITANEASLRDWRGPVMVKPANHASGFSAARFETGAAAWPRARELEAAGGRPIAQEVLDGELMAFAAVLDHDGALVSVSQQVAQHVWPPPVGITARGVTVAVDPALRTRAAALLERLGWSGLVQLQFLVPLDGEPRLIDFNGRFYGSMALAAAAGADHVAVWARVAIGERVSPVEAAPGAYYQWLTRDVRASLASEHAWRELLRAVRLAPTAAHSLFSPKEPWLAPGWLAAQAWRSLERRLAR